MMSWGGIAPAREWPTGAQGGHEGVGVTRAARLLQGFAQPVAVGRVIFLAKETGFAVVSALDAVQGYAIKVNTGAAGHKRTLAEIFEPDRMP